MRNLFALLAVLGVVGLVFGVLNMVRGSAGPFGVPFAYENYGGPGSIIAGLLLLCTAAYLFATWPRRS